MFSDLPPPLPLPLPPPPPPTPSQQQQQPTEQNDDGREIIVVNYGFTAIYIITRHTCNVIPQHILKEASVDVDPDVT